MSIVGVMASPPKLHSQTLIYEVDMEVSKFLIGGHSLVHTSNSNAAVQVNEPALESTQCGPQTNERTKGYQAVMDKSISGT